MHSARSTGNRESSWTVSSNSKYYHKSLITKTQRAKNKNNNYLKIIFLSKNVTGITNFDRFANFFFMEIKINLQKKNV